MSDSKGTADWEIVPTTGYDRYRSREQQLRPTHSQRRHMKRWLRLCCSMENHLIEVVRRMISSKYDFNYTTFSLNNLVTAIKRREKKYGRIDFYEVPGQILQKVSDNVARSVKAFFDTGKEKGYNVSRIRFRSIGSYKTFRISSQAFKLSDDHFQIKITNLKDPVRIHTTNTLPGKPVEVIIKHKNGHYNAIFVCNCGDSPTCGNMYVEGDDSVVSVDWGMEHLAVTDDGRFFEHIRFDKIEEDGILRDQRRISACIVDGKIVDRDAFAKHNRHLYHKKQKANNKKKAYYDDVATRIMGENDVLVVENINFDNIQKKNKSKGFRRSLSDSSPGLLFNRLRAKAENAAALMVRVNPANTSQICSGCGSLVGKTLDTRWHSCPECGLEMHRDVNAARNIGFKAMNLESRIPRHWQGRHSK